MAGVFPSRRGHAHVSLPSLLNCFRGAFQGLRDTYLRQGAHCLIFIGPLLPALRIAVPFEPPMSLDQVARFYCQFLSPFFGDRDILRSSLRITDACIFAAIPPGYTGCTWIVPEGCGVDAFQGDPDGHDIGTRPVLDGMILVPRVMLGRIGVCWHRFLEWEGFPAQPARPVSYDELFSSCLLLICSPPGKKGAVVEGSPCRELRAPSSRMMTLYDHNVG